jgi:DNA-binding PadR family transcriptional regulator
MPVKHALLALLAERDLTGYELKIRFERVLGEFWQLNSGQVYSTLERMRREGLISPRRESGVAESATPPPARDGADGRDTGAATIDRRRDDTVATTLDRRRYTLLPRGRRELERWLAAPVPRLRPVRDPLFVKLVFAPTDRVAALLVALGAEARRYREAVDTLDALVARTPVSHVGRTRWLVAEAARLTYAAQLAWLERAHGLIGATPTPLPAPAPEPSGRLVGLGGPRRPPARLAVGRTAAIKPVA